MSWTVIFHEEFEPEFDELSKEVQEKLIANAALLEEFGSTLSRPRVDTLKGSKYPNMKERCDPAPTKGARERAPRH